MVEALSKSITTVVATFSPSEKAAQPSPNISIPIESTPLHLAKIVEQLKLAESGPGLSFFVNGLPLFTSLAVFAGANAVNCEGVLEITFSPREPAKVLPVTRCSSALPGHTAPILVVKFGPDGRRLATGSGDKTVRLWDLNTETPLRVLEGHGHWVQALGWSPDGRELATGCYAGTLCVWDGESGDLKWKKEKAHAKAILDVDWEPFMVKGKSEFFATASMDSTIKVWSSVTKNAVLSLSGHSAAATSVCWGGKGFIYSASRDRTVRVWDAQTGQLHKELKGHAHWVNHISLSTSYALRVGFFDFDKTAHKLEKREQSQKVYEKSLSATKGRELLVSGSDDNSAYLWDPLENKNPQIQRLLGHQQPITFVRFSPNAKYVISVSFDKSVRLWNGSDGKFIKTFRGHVGAVFQLCWSRDSKFFVTGSRDSTLKVWGVDKMKRQTDLPGHEDEVYAVDWSPDGQRVASGGKDTKLLLWRN